MIKVIETNIALNANHKESDFLDHQSRVIEVESWKDYVQEIKEAKPIERKAYLGYFMEGRTIPTGSKVENLVYDDFHLSCDVTNWLNMKSKKLAYRITEEE